MMNTFFILIIVTIALLTFAALVTLIYLVPVICIQRFHTTTNILTANVCLTSFLCCLYWIAFNVMLGFYPLTLFPSTFSYVFSTYVQIMTGCLLIHSLAVVTINRYLTIIYPNKRFFKMKAWPYLSSTLQWIIDIILPMPFLIPCTKECIDITKISYWLEIYALILVIILPSILNIIFNSLIFYSVHSSTKRIHALTTTTADTNAKLNHRNTRDIHLLKHMIFIFLVFIIGWTPICVYAIVIVNSMPNIQLSQILRILPVISSLVMVFDLFYYNHDLRQYLTEKLFQLF